MADPVFTEAPEEVTRYFDAKQILPTYDWRDLVTQEHAFSFTVAKTAGFDVLEDIQGALSTAVKDYGDFGSFADELEPILRRKGWWGTQVVRNPDGALEYVRLGSLRRLRTIYWANISTARAAGEWERIQRTKRGLPFLIYELSVAENKRPEHQGWVGIVLPVDHAWWVTHYPPNGWLCQCRVRQISRREAIALGYDESVDAPQVVWRDWTNKRTGETIQVPKGIDPGWHTNPGMTRAANVNRFLSERLDALPAHRRAVAVRDMIGSPNFRELQGGRISYAGPQDRSPGNVDAGRISVPVGILSDDLQERLGVKTRTVVLSNADAHKQLRKRRTAQGDPQIVAEDYAMIQEMIEHGRAYEDAHGERTVILQMERDGKPWAAVLRVTQDMREIYLKSFRRISPRNFGPSDRNFPLYD